jgi:hypothetical protein
MLALQPPLPGMVSSPSSSLSTANVAALAGDALNAAASKIAAMAMARR